MKEEKKESPIGVLWGWGKPYHGKFIGSIILAVLGVACQMVPYFCVAPVSYTHLDYLKVGQVMEILRQRGVRLIAINDGVDSLKGDDDFTPFRNIMNEF